MSNHINYHVVLDLAKKVLRVVTSAKKISSKKRKPITDRIKELTLSAGDFSQFNLNRKSSSHDSLNHVTLTSDLPESTYTRNNSNFIDQTPDIIKDIPPEIKNSPPNDTTDESSKEKLLLGTVQWSLSGVYWDHGPDHFVRTIIKVPRTESDRHCYLVQSAHPWSGLTGPVDRRVTFKRNLLAIHPLPKNHDKIIRNDVKLIHTE